MASDAYREDGPQKGRGLATSLAVVSLVVWGALAFAVCGSGLLFSISLNRATSAPQEGAAGATFAAFFIAIYIFARCVEKILAAVERLNRKK